MSETKLSLYEEDLYGEKETMEPMCQLVVFALESEWYGVDIQHVREVLNAPALTVLPNVPPHILGIFNLRGNILSATHLKTLFGLVSEEVSEKGRVVVIESGELATGLLVDGSEEALEIPISKIEPLVSTLEGEKGEWMEGQVEWKGKLIGILNTQTVLSKTKL